MNILRWHKPVYLLVVLALGLSLGALGAVRIANAAGTYYVDCSAGTNGNGSQASPWNNLATVSATTFGAGDSILLKRGTMCLGTLWPKGSGVSGSPITLGAYGTGALPIVNGNNTTNAVVELFNQQYWVVQDLEITGGQAKGLYISGTGGSVPLNYFRVTNVNSHNHGINDGESAIYIGEYKKQSVNDVVVDNVTGHDAFRGIDIGGDCCNNPAIRSNNITVRNSTVWNSHNDGIFVFSSNNVLMENNVAWDTGIQPVQENHTPNGIWTWDCDNCVVQFNESRLAHSPEWDGGGFDIDYFDHNNIVQYNYGHDNDAYCMSVFGGDGADVTTNSVLRYNICSNNLRDGTYLGKRQGDLYITVWSQGGIQDTYAYNNTFYYNPATPPAGEAYYAIKLFDIWHGKSLTNTNIYNNIFYSTSPNLMNVADFAPETHLNNNLYWYTGAGNPNFVWNGSTYTSFSAYQAGSGQDAQGKYVNPLLNDPTYHANGFPSNSFTLQSGSQAINAGANLVALGLQTSMGARDFFGNSIPQGGAYDIGAHESGGAPAPTATPTNTIPPSPTPLPTNTPTPGPSPTPTNTPTRTNTPLPTNTPTVGPSPTPTATSNGNLALNRPVTVSSVQAGAPAINAVDGNIGTYWRSEKRSSLSAEWISVDLGSSLSVSQVVLKWNTYYAISYTIQVSTDGINWSTVYSTTSGNGATDTITFSPTSARYVKMNSTSWNNSGERCWLNEFEIYP